MWHDISGPDPPWFLESVVICHLNTGVTWYFEANRWLDVSTGSKEVECKLKPLKRKSILSVKTMFDAKIVDNLKNKLIWLSLLYKRNRRTFSKFQKMSSCLAVAGLTILITAVLVDTTQDLFSNSSITMGPWELILGDIYRALVCSGIAFVYRLLLEILFVNSAPNSMLRADDNNVQGYIDENFEKLNKIIFLDENDDADCASNCENENVSSSGTCDVELEFANPEELKTGNEDADRIHLDNTINDPGQCLSNKKAMNLAEEKCSLNEAESLADLIDILGNFPEKQEIIQIFDHNSCVPPSSQSDEPLESNETSNGDPNESSNFAFGKDSGVNMLDRRQSVAWAATVTNPDKIPKLWRNLPFPQHLIDEHSIRKIHHDSSSILPQIVLNITQAQCFVFPFICTIIAIATGFHWSDNLTKSWLVTFSIAFFCEVFVLETFYVFLHAIYFLICRQRPVKEEDLLDTLSNKVWVNDEKTTAYYSDVVDEEEGELVPRPPTEADIQKAQENAGKERELEDVLKMLCFDVLFIALLILISFGNRDTSAYPVRAGLENSFNISKSFNAGVKIMSFSKTICYFIKISTMNGLSYSDLNATSRLLATCSLHSLVV